MLTGWTLNTFNQVEGLAAKILEPIQQPDPQGQHIIELVFESPSNIDQVRTEIKRLKNHPKEWRDS
jgi:hypothetical protein